MAEKANTRTRKGTLLVPSAKVKKQMRPLGRSAFHKILERAITPRAPKSAQG